MCYHKFDRCAGMFFKSLINITNLNSKIFKMIAVSVFEFFLQQGPWDLLQGLIISCCIVFRFYGMVISSFMTAVIIIFGFKFWKITIIPSVWNFVSQ